jgi:hypothetical protein
VIRNVCIHVENEQPLLADLYTVPTAADAGLLCTNVRMMDGKRPVFIDRTDATFFFPYHVVRFIEIPEGALAGIDVGAASGGSSGRSNGDAAEQGRDLPALRLPVPVPAAADDEPEGDLDLEIDEGLMQRIRDI